MHVSSFVNKYPEVYPFPAAKLPPISRLGPKGMDDRVLITLLGIGAGAVGYLAVTFWFQPILRYRETKFRIASDLVFFANAMELQKTDGSIRADTLERKDSNRHCAAELNAIYPELPTWYQCWLKCRTESPAEASSELIRLSNVSSREEAHECVNAIRVALRLPRPTRGRS